MPRWCLNYTVSKRLFIFFCSMNTGFNCVGEKNKKFSVWVICRLRWGGEVVTPSKLCLEGCQGHVSCQECKLCSYTSLSGSCYVTWCKSSAFDPHVLQLADQCSALASQSLRVAFLYMPAVGIHTLTPLPCGGWFVPFGHKKPFCLCLFVSVSVID